MPAQAGIQAPSVRMIPIHVFDYACFKTWMPATSAGMTIHPESIPR
jgi:hypothetical protein